MQKNISETQANLRVIIGCIIVIVGFYFWSYWGLLGLGVILTGHFRFCPPCAWVKIPGVCDLKK